MVQFLSMEGEVRVPAQWAEYGEYLKRLTEADYLKFYRDMARIRRFDIEAIALQRQGQLVGLIGVKPIRPQKHQRQHRQQH